MMFQKLQEALKKKIFNRWVSLVISYHSGDSRTTNSGQEMEKRTSN